MKTEYPNMYAQLEREGASPVKDRLNLTSQAAASGQDRDHDSENAFGKAGEGILR